MSDIKNLYEDNPSDADISKQDFCLPICIPVLQNTLGMDCSFKIVITAMIF